MLVGICANTEINDSKKVHHFIFYFLTYFRMVKKGDVIAVPTVCKFYFLFPQNKCTFNGVHSLQSR